MVVGIIGTRCYTVDAYRQQRGSLVCWSRNSTVVGLERGVDAVTIEDTAKSSSSHGYREKFQFSHMERFTCDMTFFAVAIPVVCFFSGHY